MAHKTNPRVLRIKETKDWHSRWFKRGDLKNVLKEDYQIREFLFKKLKDCGVEKIDIERFPGKTSIIIYSSRPGLIIGRRGKGIEEIKRGILKLVSKEREESVKKKGEYSIEIREVRDMWKSAPLIAQWIANQLERRVGYRRTLKQALSKIKERKENKGVRLEVAGRLDGVEISRTEWMKYGKFPRQTLRANIDYGEAKAFCTYGVIGVKVWLYKGEKFE